MIDRRVFLGTLAGGPLAAPPAVEAPEARPHRAGGRHHGGPGFGAGEWLRQGLREVGVEEGRQVVLHVRDCRGDLRVVEQTAVDLEHEKVDVIYSVGTSVTRLVKRATKSVPIVFNAGSDPVAF